MIDINKLTLGEIGSIEKLSGQSIDALGADGTPKGLLLAALYYVNKRREVPAFTWNLANEVPMDEALDYLGLSGAESDEPEVEPDQDPTETD